MVSDELKEYIKSCIEKLEGVNSAQAYHNLVEANDEIIPLLIEEFHAQKDSTTKAMLVEIIWQHRLPTTVDFLAEALADKDKVVWKSALDGLVTIGGKKSLDILEVTRQKFLNKDAKEQVRIEWINEAIEQIQ